MRELLSSCDVYEFRNSITIIVHIETMKMMVEHCIILRYNKEPSEHFAM